MGFCWFWAAWQDGAVRGVQLQGARGELTGEGAVVKGAHLPGGPPFPRERLHQWRTVAQAVET